MAQSVKPADAGISVGEVLLGKYRVEAILGQGGMGVVAECTHLTLNERVAVKMLRQDVHLDHDAKARFVREAQAAAKLKSEYVAKVSDVGTFESGVPYMVMEFLEGLDLGELLKERGAMPVQWAVELMLQTAEALCEAHSHGIVHRDVKPTNLFVTWRPDGSALIKVLDFGISKSAAGTDMHLTQTQSLLGTPAYMSPEQMRSARTVDNRTDIWSLGTVFYEALEGHKPFEAESFSEMCVKVAVDAPAPMTNAPAGLQQVILKCLAKAPEQRYASMAEFARELVPYSADPHAAQVMVDRMGRMLRRSNVEWGGGSSGVYRPAEAPGRPQTSPTAGWGNDAGAWHGNTPTPFPAPRPRTTPLPGSLSGFGPDPSQPFGRPLDESHVVGSTIHDGPPKKRLGVVLFALLAVAGGAIAFGVMKMTERADPAPAQQQQQQQQQQQAQTGSATPSPVVAGGATAPTVVPPTDTKPTVETPAPGSTAVTQPPEAGSDVAPPTPKATPKSPRSPKSTPKVTPKATPKTTAPVEKTQEKTTTPPPETKPECDPFGSMHGCAKSK